MPKSWIFLMALAMAGAALAQGDKAGKADEPKAPAPKATAKKSTGSPAPRMGPGQAASPAAKDAPAEAPKQAK